MEYKGSSDELNDLIQVKHDRLEPDLKGTGKGIERDR